MKAKTQKSIEYVSRDMVRGELDDFTERRFPEIVRKVGEKHINTICSHLARNTSITACAELAFSLHLKGATFSDNPSYRQQLTMLYDFRQLLKGEKAPKYFTNHRKDYYRQYDNICTLLDEYEKYQKVGEMSIKFLRLVNIEQENIPPEHTEEYLTCAREITLVMIDEVTHMVRDQIYRTFPSKAERFVQEILKENSHDGVIEHGAGETLVGTKKVTFSL